MISKERLVKFRTGIFKDSLKILEKKGADYNRKQQNDGDTLFNLRIAKMLGITETNEQGIMVRLSDKLMRLASLTRPGIEARVKDESIRDTVIDIHNYVDYLLAMRMERMGVKI